jgi:hypothetical protein
MLTVSSTDFSFENVRPLRPPVPRADTGTGTDVHAKTTDFPPIFAADHPASAAGGLAASQRVIGSIHDTRDHSLRRQVRRVAISIARVTSYRPCK